MRTQASGNSPLKNPKTKQQELRSTQEQHTNRNSEQEPGNHWETKHHHTRTGVLKVGTPGALERGPGDPEQN